MVKKTVTYNDFDGNERTEDFYFNLSESELVDLRFSINGGLEKRLEQIVKADDEKELISYFKEIVLLAYGKKSLDGRTFTKNDAIREEFASTMAYNKIFMDLVKDDKIAAEFINGIIPHDNDGGNKGNITALPGKAPIPDVAKPTN